MKKKKQIGEDLRVLHQYNSNFHDAMVFSLAQQNCNVEKICKSLSISRITLYKWFKLYHSFRDSYVAGQKDSCDLVEASFFRLLMPHILTETETHYNAQGEIIKTIVKKKEIDPNPNACFRWLACKKREEWVWPTDEANTETALTVVIDKEDENL